MQGIIELYSGTYLFRNDHGYGNEIWAWNIYDEMNGDRVKTHKWKKFPKKKNRIYVTGFDIENPPVTVSYIPLLGV